ncbi:erythromycin esterase family protein [Echinicola shivajiensis]|uniref:erythromycin esterase family protein n=1 Tax=Echinicola shivajiensis TaxID=1035916 RepID=UPI001BFC12CC|nr:erythromycin esterase family protein [Echinicola shivajiensis]
MINRKIVSFLFLGVAALIISYHFILRPFLYPFNEDVKGYVLKNIEPITTINPDGLEFQDLNVLRKSIGDSRVVLLGEQDHGDAATFLAKTRIIKFLHQSLDFDVLVFESDFYGLNYSNNNLIENVVKGSHSFVDNIYPLWGQCDSFKPMIDYIIDNRGTSNPLTVSGIDPRHVLKCSREHYLDDLSSFINESEVSIAPDKLSQFYKTVETVLTDEYSSNVTGDQLAAFYEVLLEVKSSAIGNVFWEQEMRNLEGFVRNSLDSSISNNIRDVQMGDNLLWLLNKKYKDKKVVVWASNTHIFKDFSIIKEQNLILSNPDTINTGSYVYEKLKDEMYVLGVTSYSGNGGRLGEKGFEIIEPQSNFFESWVYETDFPYAFIDFSNMPENLKKEMFFMKTLVHKPRIANWFNMFDGIIYIQNMFPCKSEQVTRN